MDSIQLQGHQFLSDFDRKAIEVEDCLSVVLKPHAGQRMVLQELVIKMMALVFLQVGRKWGKSELALYACYWFAMMFDGCEVYYIADTQKHARELVWTNRRMPDFLKKVRRGKTESREDYEERKKTALANYNRWVVDCLDSTMKVKLANGSVICVDGAENYANADGVEPQFLVYDEFKSHDPRFNEAMEPNLEVYNAPLLVIGTPPDNSDNYYCKIAEDARRRDDAVYFELPSFWNDFIYPGGEQGEKFQRIVKKYLDRGEWDVLQREYYGRIVAGGAKSIFPMFSKEKNVFDYDKLMINISRYPKDWDFYAGFDPGTATCFAALFVAVHKKTKSFVVLDEIYETDKKLTVSALIWERAQKIMDDIRLYREDWQITYDYAAAWFAAEISVRFDVGLTPCTKDLKSKENKLSLMKDIMLAGKYIVSSRCPNHVREVSNYITDDKGKIPKENDHTIDVARYIINLANYDITDLIEIPKPIDYEPPRGYAIEAEVFSGMEDEFYE